MAERRLNGTDILLFVNTGADPDNPDPAGWLPVMCPLTNPFTRTRPTTTEESKCGPFTTYGKPQYGSTFTGLMLAGYDNTVKISHNDLVQYFGTAITDPPRKAWMIAPTIPKTGDPIIKFVGTLTTYDNDFPNNASSTFSGTITIENDSVVEAPHPNTDSISSVAVTAGNVTKNSTNNSLYVSYLQTSADETVTQISTTLTGTLAAGDLTNVKLYRNTSPNLTGAVQVGATFNAATTANGATINFTLSGVLPVGNYYYIITADIATGAVTGHTVIASKLAYTGLSGTITDSQTANGGTKTIA